jgi:hypothetical protein
MLANHWNEEEIARQRRFDYMRMAEHERLVRQTTDGKLTWTVSIRQRLGAWLVVAGQRLQSQSPSLRNVHQL